MHISPPFEDPSILNDNDAFLAKKLWRKLKPEQWPFAFADFPEGSVLVGGAIRDALLAHTTNRLDFDLVVPSQAIVLAKRLSKKFNGKLIVLDEKRDIARLIFHGLTFDIASQIGSDISEDLRRRDFTVNAIALSICKAPKILDPTGGIKDLNKKRLVAICEKNFLDDPLRLLRGFRLMAELDLFLDDQTKTFINIHANLLPSVAPERIQSEIKCLVRGRNAERAISFVQQSKILQPWANKNEISCNKFHSLEEVKSLQIDKPVDILEISRLTYLLSDYGMAELKFSRKYSRRCSLLRRWQKVIINYGLSSLSEFDRVKLHQDLELDLPALILNLPLEDQSIWIKRWKNKNDPLFHPSSPLTGHTLKESLGLKDGPELGSIIRDLCIERAFGRLQNSDEALEMVRKWLVDKKTFL